MSEPTAEGSMEVNVGAALEAIQSLEEHLAALQEKFANAGPGITSHLQGIDAAAANAAAAMQGTAASAGGMTGMFGSVGASVRGFIGHMIELSHWTFLLPNSLGALGGALGGLLGRIHPAGAAMVSAFSNALPGIKHVFEYVSVADRAFQALGGRLGPLGAAMGYFSLRTLGASRAMAGLASAAALATSATVATASAIGAAVRGMTAVVVSSFGMMGTALHAAIPELLPLALVVLAVASAFALLKKAVNVSAGFEVTTTSFKTLVGNAALAKKSIADLIEFSNRSGTFDKFQVTEAGRQLVAFGFAADGLLPVMTDVGDLAAGMNKSLIDVANAFGYLKAGQFGNAFSSFRTLGITQQELEMRGLKFDKSGQYKGSVEAAMEAVRSIIRDRFGGSMEDLSKTWNGLWSQLVSQTGNALRAIGEPILEQLKPMLAELVRFMHEMLPIAQVIGQVIGIALKKINDALGFKPIIPGDRPDRERLPEMKPDQGFDEIKVGKMREMGGGGAFHVGLGNGGDPLLDSSRRQERQLDTIAGLLRGDKAIGGRSPAPSFEVGF